MSWLLEGIITLILGAVILFLALKIIRKWEEKE